MIIQCIKCSTKFRFDESLVEGDGVWVRCSRCQEVFFQENPFQTELREASVTVADMSAAPLESDAGFPEVEKSLDISGNQEDIDAILAKVEETKKTIEEHHLPETFVNIEKEVGKDEEPEVGGLAEVVKPADAERSPFESAALAAKGSAQKPGKLGFWTPWRIIALIVFINLLFGGIYVTLSPEMSKRVSSSLSSAVSFFGDTEKKPVEFSLNQIKLKDVRQRFVENVIAGKLRVIEGVAENSSSHPVTRMQVKGELYDTNGVIITERLAYSGNLLTDDELATLSEEDLQRELDLPMGSDAQNIRVEPKGYVPFMIVFSHEPPGVVTAKVMTVAGEKLLK